MLAFLSACAVGSGPPVNYYVLDTVSESSPAGADPAGRGPLVSVAPVALPAYLDQPSITTRDQESKIKRADSDRWAGPLGAEVTRAVGENLSVMVPTDRLVVASSGREVPEDFFVQVEISEFERGQGNQVRLIARWSVFSGDNRAPVIMRTSRISRPASAADYASTVTAMSLAIEDLSREIASVIQTREREARQQSAPPPPRAAKSGR